MVGIDNDALETLNILFAQPRSQILLILGSSI